MGSMTAITQEDWEEELARIRRAWREQREKIARDVVQRFLGTVWGYSDIFAHLGVKNVCAFAKVVEAVINNNVDIKIVESIVNTSTKIVPIGDYIGSYEYDGVEYEIFMQINRTVPAVYLHVTDIVNGDRFRDFLAIVRPKS